MNHWVLAVLDVLVCGTGSLPSEKRGDFESDGLVSPSLVIADSGRSPPSIRFRLLRSKIDI